MVRSLLLLLLFLMFRPISSFLSHRPPMRRMLSVTRRYLNVNINCVGKPNSVEPYLKEGYAEYEKRLKPTLKLTTNFLKNDAALVKSLEKEKYPESIILLDESGTSHTSISFTSLLYKTLSSGSATVNFYIGAAEGFPASIKQDKRYKKINLGNMTWPHQVVRLLIVEQIYRATEIRKGSGYHKE
ncbi:hypothetical protein TL16_g10799 [Triparma laevis f. inornata]|uniref:Ribosomal RNA large subunit methyltransferase H n=2 Tax=Triparma laevis TaxID=1534972 RepID=A0A9W7C8P6_9STRA|nr:hypothetical protein TL16_g10799 [Triparma laevis f. inornata]GMI02032.1 hypothetical protein TrLO_g10434 [Triparma laevis f. longispina]